MDFEAIGNLIGTFLPLLVIVGGLMLGVVFGMTAERRHFRRLAERESQISIPVVDLKTLPPGLESAAGGGALVMGQVVIASDYLKTMLSGFRKIFGGEMKSFERMIERARREALLRAIDECESKGGIALINVRFETSQIDSMQRKKMRPMAEVLCFGTAVLPATSAT